MTSAKIPFTTALRSGVLSALLCCLCFLSGCRSAFVQATIVNHSGTALRLVELDYPSASFGTTNLESNAEYHYRFKIQGSGSVKLDFVDVQGKALHSVGPELDEGQQGTLVATIDGAGRVTWTPNLTISK